MPILCIHANSESMQFPCTNANSMHPCKFRGGKGSMTESIHNKSVLEQPRLHRVCKHYSEVIPRQTFQDQTIIWIDIFPGTFLAFKCQTTTLHCNVRCLFSGSPDQCVANVIFLWQMNIRIYWLAQITNEWMSTYIRSSTFFMNEYPNIFVHVVCSQMNVWINLNKKTDRLYAYIHLGSEDLMI